MENVEQKIKALMAKAVDPASTAAEAETAMMMARKLMDKHGVNEDDLKKADASGWRDATINGRATKYGAIFHPVDVRLGGLIGRFCGCYCYFEGRQTSNPKVVYFGQPSDVEYALFLRAAFQAAYDDGWYVVADKYGVRAIKGARQEYTKVFCDTMIERLDGWLYRTMQDVEPGGTALVVQKQDLAKSELSNRGMNFGAFGLASSGNSHRGEAAGAARNAANNMTMGRGMQGGGAKQIGVAR